MRILDLYCGAGGAAMGYHRAGFEVVGVDLHPQPNYPYRFVQGDAMRNLARRPMSGSWIVDCDEGFRLELGSFDAIHASPPCQAYSTATGQSRKAGKREYVDLIEPTRSLLEASGLPYVIENVVGAPLLDPVRLCGTAFGLPLRRHRLFETNWPAEGIACRHGDFTERRYWTGWRPNGEHRLSTVVQVYGNGANAHEWAEAMQIDWMTKAELAQAIPPAYTEHIGRQLIRHVAARRNDAHLLAEGA